MRELPEFGMTVHGGGGGIERALEFDEDDEDDGVEGAYEVAIGDLHDDDDDDVDVHHPDLQVDGDNEDEEAESGRRAGPTAHHAGARLAHKQDATIQMVKWTRAAITTRKKVLKEVDENEPTGLDWFEEDYLKNLLTIQEYERKFVVLAHQWRRFMNFYGLIEDVSLLLVDCPRRDTSELQTPSGSQQRKSTRFVERAKPARRGPKSKAKPRSANHNAGLEPLRKILWLLLIASANLLTIYMLIVHMAWELHRLDATISTAVASVNDSLAVQANGNQTGAGPKQMVAVVVVAGSPQLATFNGWSILKDFLENLRRHLSRFFALVLIFIWHKNCHKFERLFVDCRRYYAAFYPKLSSLGMSELCTTTTTTTTATGETVAQVPPGKVGSRKPAKERTADDVRKIRVILTIREHQLQLIEAASRFYKLAWGRIAFAVWFPFAHLAFNLVGVLLAPNALIIANNGQQATASPHAASSVVATNISVPQRLMQNFETFHMAVHTAFHPYEHQIVGRADSTQPQAPISPNWSAFYCLAELFVHYIFVNGPRIVCATCLSLVLSIHHQCLRAFNKNLTNLIRRGRESPLSRWDMVKLLKQYDMIGMMHERIESTFKWSLVSWFTLMFLSCLMLIFTLTESTSAAFYGTSLAPATAASQPIGTPDILETICPVAIMLARIFFVCYAPILIYTESFKLESESARATQLIMLLARRQDDPVAQAIEPALFGPIQLSAGGFFPLSKRSVAPLLGAIVTFSIMFIDSGGEELAGTRRHWPDDTGRRDGTTTATDPDDDAAQDAEEQEDVEDEDESEPLEEDEELPDDAAAGASGARSMREADGAHRQRHRATVALVDQETAKQLAGQRKPGGRHAKINLSAAVGSGVESSKARQWRKYKRLNRKSELDTDQSGGKQSAINHRHHALGLQTNSKLADGPRRAATPTGNQVEQDQEHLTRPMRPRLAAFYLASLRENERQLSLVPRLKVENQIEICDFELRGPEENATRRGAEGSGGLFAVTWIDRMSGEIAIEATNLTLINCERQRNYTLGMRAIACNGLESNEATLRIELEDVNEFSPEFERSQYSVSVDTVELESKRQFVNDDGAAEDSGDLTSTWCHLLTVRAHDQDCSREFGQVCRYELVGGPDTRHPDTQQQPEVGSNVRVDAQGNLKARCKWLLGQVDTTSTATSSFLFQVVAFDCGGKKSQRPASVLLDIRHHHSAVAAQQQQASNVHGLKRETLNETGGGTDQCRPSWKDVDTQIAYKPASGEHWPFLRAKLDLCSIKCHRPLNLTVRLQLEATPPPSSAGGSSEPAPGGGTLGRRNPTPVFHCDRDPYAMVSKRRLCGARRKTLELLPSLSAHTQWIGPLVWRPTAVGGVTTAGRGPRRPNHRRPKVTGKVQVLAPLQGNNSTESKGGDEYANPALQADELPPPLNPDDDDEGPGEGEQEEAQRPGTEEPAERGHSNEDEENLGAYLPDGSYGQLAREFAARERQSQLGGWAKSADLPVELLGPRTGNNGGDDRKQPRRQTRASERVERHRLRKGAIYRDQVYHFDGANDALLVPSFVYQQHLDFSATTNRTDGILFGLQHTLSFWMRHGEFKFTQRSNETERQREELRELSRHVREHLLCVSERRHSMSEHKRDHRHHHNHHQHHSKHYAVYMRNCRLNLLMSRSPMQVSENDEVEPHEWRWSLDQTGQFCDNKWHLYTINVNYPQVELYVDGQQFDTEKKVVVAPPPPATSSPVQVIETSSSDKAGSMVLTLGACWDARSRSMVGHFRGALSGLNILAHANDEPSSIECLGHCTESLVSSAPQNDQQLRATTPVQSNQRQPQDNSLVAFQEAQDRIQLRGHDPLDLEDALAQLAYVNRRQLPSIGRRTINVVTNLSCHMAAAATTGTTSGGQVQLIPVDALKIDVNVLPSTSLPVISLAGTPNLAREHLPFIRGQVAPFESIKLQVKQVSLLDAAGKAPSPATPAAERQRGRVTLKSSQLTADLLDYIDDATLNLHHHHHHHQSPPGGATSSAGISLEASENLANSRAGRIESCHIQASPPLDESHETLELPIAELQRLELYWRQSSSGAVIYGLDSARNYESLLRMILYRNERPGAYEERLFHLACSDMSGRLLSNEHHQRLTVIHPRPLAAAGSDQQDAVPLDTTFTSTNETSNDYFSSLRHSAGPHLTLANSEQVVADAAASHDQRPPSGGSAVGNKLDRIAMAFLVFVVSLILIVLVIALTNLRETTESDTSGRRKKSSERHIRPGSARKQCPMLAGSLELERRQHRCTNSRSYIDDEAELSTGMARNECYLAHDELVEHEESYISDDEFEEDDEFFDERERRFEEDDAMTQYDDREQLYDLSVRSENRRHMPAYVARMSPPSSVDLDSLSWDDELICRHHNRHHHHRHHHHHQHPKSSPVSTTIVINPLAHSSNTGTAGTNVARRTLVASIKRGATKLGTQPQSHLAIEPAKTERASSVSGAEDDSESEGSVKTMGARSLIDDEEDLLVMDEDMASSLCSQSRSCSLTSLASQGTEMTAGEQDQVDTDQEYHGPRYDDESHAMAHMCSHRNEVRAPAYEIYHRHHHRCLRAEAAQHRVECSQSTQVNSDNESK